MSAFLFQLISKQKTLLAIERAAADTQVMAKDWCTRISALDPLKCTASFQKLALTDQLDRDSVDHVRNQVNLYFKITSLHYAS